MFPNNRALSALSQRLNNGSMNCSLLTPTSRSDRGIITVLEKAAWGFLLEQQNNTTLRKEWLSKSLGEKKTNNKLIMWISAWVNASFSFLSPYACWSLGRKEVIDVGLLLWPIECMSEHSWILSCENTFSFGECNQHQSITVLAHKAEITQPLFISSWILTHVPRIFHVLVLDQGPTATLHRWDHWGDRWCQEGFGCHAWIPLKGF